jgi:putative membrane protein
MDSKNTEGLTAMFGDWRFGVIAVIILIILLMFVIWNVARGWGGHRHDPLLIARERYARGEITLEQFDAIKKDLMECSSGK